MAAPGVIVRGAPAGSAIPRGGPCKFALGLLPTFAMWEFEITPGKITGGPPINFSSFFNAAMHTQLPQFLYKSEPWTIKGKYDADVWKPTMIQAVINKIGVVTFLEPRLGTVSNYGWVRDCTFGTFKWDDTVPPTLELLIEISSWDPVNHVEATWNYVDGYTGTADT